MQAKVGRRSKVAERLIRQTELQNVAFIGACWDLAMVRPLERKNNRHEAVTLQSTTNVPDNQRRSFPLTATARLPASSARHSHACETSAGQLPLKELPCLQNVEQAPWPSWPSSTGSEVGKVAWHHADAGRSMDTQAPAALQGGNHSPGRASFALRRPAEASPARAASRQPAA